MYRPTYNVSNSGEGQNSQLLLIYLFRMEANQYYCVILATPERSK